MKTATMIRLLVVSIPVLTMAAWPSSARAAAPVLDPIANMTLCVGSTADQAISATDPDGDAITFTSSGPTFMTRFDNAQVGNSRTGNIHLAPPLGTVGTFGASVTATANAEFDDQTFTITVTAGPCPNSSPTLTQPANMTVNEGSTANQTLNATDPDGNPLTFAQVSGPTYVTVTTTTPGTGTATGNVNLAPGFSDSGSSTVSVSASDGSLTDGRSFTITVNNVNRAPVLNQPANMTVPEGSTRDQAISGSDPDGDALTFSKVAGPTFMTVTTTSPTTGNIHLATGFNDLGTYSATVRAGDGNLNSDRPFSITVCQFCGSGPNLAQPANMTVNEGATANQTLSATDPDGDPLTFSKVAGPVFMTVTTTSPGTGTATGNINVAPGFSDSGTYSATVRVSDASTSTDKSLTITVNNVNRAPVLAQPANMTVQEGCTADQTITASDPDGDPLTFSKVAGPTFISVSTTSPTTGNIHLAPGFADQGTASSTVRASDGVLSDSKSFIITVPASPNPPPNLNTVANMTVDEGATADQVITGSDPGCGGGTLTFAKVAGPVFMTVTTTTPGPGTATGNIHLAPGFTQSGTYSATVRATDSFGAGADRSFTITVNNVNRAPVLNQPANMTVPEGSTRDQAISGSDPDGDALTFSKVAGPTFMTVTTTSPTTGNIHLATGFNDLGTYSATVRASDGSLNSDRPFSITVCQFCGNSPPTLAQPANMTVNEGATANQTLTATDPDGDPLTFSKVSGPTYVTVTTITPGIGTATGNVRLAPGFSDAGSSSVTVRATDTFGLSDAKSFAISVNDVNRAPTLVQPANMTVTGGSTANQTLAATDPDGDPLSFSKTAGPTFMTVTTTSPGTGTATGNVNLAPGFLDSGTYGATVSITDGLFPPAGKSFTITVCDPGPPPVLAQPANMSVTEGTTANQALSATDPDGNPLTFSKTAGPTFMTVTTTSPGTGTATGNVHLEPGFSDAGVFQATVSVSDGSLCGTDSKSLTITVADGSLARAFTTGGNKTIRLGSSKPFWSAQVEPIGGSFAITDVDPATLVLISPGTGSVSQISAVSDRTVLIADLDNNDIADMRARFRKQDLRMLFSNVTGTSTLTVSLGGDVITGGSFRAAVDVEVVGPDEALVATVAPNPFNPAGTLTFTTEGHGSAKVELFDVSGRLVRTILDEPSLAPGLHEVKIEGRGRRGESLASGIYFIRGVSAEGEFTKTIAILK